MGDSPLSITSSVTGILTFVAAILAFLYVRYTTLRASHEEVTRVLDSVTTSRRQVAVIEELDDDNEDDWRIRSIYRLVAEIIVDIDRTEEDIMAELDYIKDSQRKDEIATSSKDKKWWRKFGRPSTTADQAGGARCDVSAILFGIVYGSTFMFRWYRVRENIMKMVQERDKLRSRLVFNQLTLINLRLSQASKQAREQSCEIRRTIKKCFREITNENYATIETTASNAAQVR